MAWSTKDKKRGKVRLRSAARSPPQCLLPVACLCHPAPAPRPGLAHSISSQQGREGPQVSSGPSAVPSTGTPQGAAPPRFFRRRVRGDGGQPPPCRRRRVIGWGGQGPPKLCRTAPAPSAGSSAVQPLPRSLTSRLSPRGRSTNPPTRVAGVRFPPSRSRRLPRPRSARKEHYAPLHPLWKCVFTEPGAEL
ncbi:hypothetical protein NDU88_003474 [Pleurodeles waltl]|uniref:Uncharacterized protein n=1 Tax=Pleurodeles waltl TaxID=8319 RepID=A0AAV7LFX2_PLEWA|nr:hypothetical protein NDU88_003474 [Pleurodeles waltl]